MKLQVGDLVRPVFTYMVDIVLHRAIGHRYGAVVSKEASACYIINWYVDGRFQIGGHWHRDNLQLLPPLEALARTAE